MKFALVKGEVYEVENKTCNCLQGVFLKKILGQSFCSLFSFFQFHPKGAGAL